MCSDWKDRGKRVGYRGASSEHLCLWKPLILLQNLWFWEVFDIYCLLFLHYIFFPPLKTSFPTNISMFFFFKNDIINFFPSEHANYHFQNDILNSCQRIWSVAGSYHFQNFPAPRAHSRHAYCRAGSSREPYVCSGIKKGHDYNHEGMRECSDKGAKYAVAVTVYSNLKLLRDFGWLDDWS